MKKTKESYTSQDKPDVLFEVSWEVCNKVGGIYTVLSTKYAALAAEMDPAEIIMIGPDVWKETTEHLFFEEDPELLKGWREHAESQDLFFRVGRWKIPGNPLAVLIDFTSFFPQKDSVFTRFWEDFGLDSISGQWDYIEPAIFGYAAGRVIESYYRTHLTNRDKVLAHFHEWMTGSGVLYLNKSNPGIATAFTTHATVLGRSIAGNGLPLYSKLGELQGDAVASRLQVKSKHSLEKLAAKHADLFTTVSQITAKECKTLVGKTPDVITPNGFNPDWVPTDQQLATERKTSREVICKVAEMMFKTSFDENTMLVLNSGRYEYRNKGIDLFLEAASKLSKDAPKNRKTVAIIAVPGYHHGPRPDLLQIITGKEVPLNGTHHALTHMLNKPEDDPVLNTINRLEITNQPDQNLFVMFVPTYLNGNDGIFNLDYYQFLAAFDLTIFPSYYEPWGYTPLESIAFGIPTITTSLAGFGVWVKETVKYQGDAVGVIKRSDDNDREVAAAMHKAMARFLSMDSKAWQHISQKAREIAAMANWKSFITHYISGYCKAMQKAMARAESDPFVVNRKPKPVVKIQKQQPVWRKLLVKAGYPESLEKMRKLADNLWWCWNPRAIALFQSAHPELWEQSGNNPIKMMSMMGSDHLEALSKNDTFLEELNQVWQMFDQYMGQDPSEEDSLVAYFSMEYGLHESLKIYSGGLGILAGDYLKEASDYNKRMVAVGLLFRYGYFTQQLSPSGEQESKYIPQKFSELPIHPVRDEHGEWVTISIAFPGRNLKAKVWEVKVGRISLYLLDTDLDINVAADRAITHQLYGGDWENRLKQEILLGVGGIRLLEKLGISPQVYHCNEGHAAFIGFERMRDLVQKEYLTYEEALEVVRSSTLFTTHTPVPAGHDRFPQELLRIYIGHYPDRLHITWEELMGMGKENIENPNELFSMSVLGIKTAQEVNGVSKLHGEVSRNMFAGLYEGYYADELHINHVTNGVHYPTWTHPQWQKVHGRFLDFPELNHQTSEERWQGINDVSDEEIWNTRRQLKEELLQHLQKRIKTEMSKRQEAPAHIVKVIDSLEQPWLTIGFARRFATYKRAHLLFSNPERLAQLLNDQEQPIRFVFAGKAHPNDQAGQGLIKRIIEMSHQKPFVGKILFVENYDMELGRFLTQGCDIWLNTPARPMEASGTSGEKAVMNGVLNLSVLDGWWAEGYQPDAGWALPQEPVYHDHEKQDQLDAETIYNLLEEKIKPAFYQRNEQGVPETWVTYIKNNFREIAPHFTMRRMLTDYCNKFYDKLAKRDGLIRSDHYRNARVYAAWKRKVLVRWSDIKVLDCKVHDSTTAPLHLNEPFTATIRIEAHGLSKDDLKVELLVGLKVQDKVEKIHFKERLHAVDEENGIITFECNVSMKGAGVFDYSFRITPDHPLMAYGMDFPLVKWL